MCQWNCWYRIIFGQSVSVNCSWIIQAKQPMQNQSRIYMFQNIISEHIGHYHDDVIKWKHFPRYWPFVRGIHRSPANSHQKDQWRGALMFSLICVWINDWVNNREAGDLRRHRTHYDVIVMIFRYPSILGVTAMHCTSRSGMRRWDTPPPNLPVIFRDFNSKCMMIKCPKSSCCNGR